MNRHWRNTMRRRSFLALGGTSLALAQDRGRRPVIPECGCAFAPQPPQRGPGQATLAGFERVQSGLKVTGMKVFGVSLNRSSDRPYVFVKIETNQGLVGWGEGTLEGKAGATMACVEDFRDVVLGADPMHFEHIWQSMYVVCLYRAEIGGGPSGGKGLCADGVVRRLLRLRCGRGPDAGRAHLAIDVRPQLLPRGAGDGFSDIGHRPSSVGHPRQGAGRARVPSSGRPARSPWDSRLLPRRWRAHARCPGEAPRNRHQI